MVQISSCQSYWCYEFPDEIFECREFLSHFILFSLSTIYGQCSGIGVADKSEFEVVVEFFIEVIFGFHSGDMLCSSVFSAATTQWALQIVLTKKPHFKKP